MAYTKKTWAANTALTYTDLDHIEDQYDEIMAYLAAHNHNTRYYIKATSDSYFWDTATDGAASGFDADTLDGEETADIVGGADIGLGGYWYGSLLDFTDGHLTADTTWHICDGTDGTIDLRDVFLIGAGGYFAVGASGGNATFKPAGSITIAVHTLTAPETMHAHIMDDYYGSGNSGTASISYTPFDVVNTLFSTERQTSSIGGGGSHDHPGSFTGSESSLMPLYKTLIPIQKIA